MTATAGVAADLWLMADKETCSVSSQIKLQANKTIGQTVYIICPSHESQPAAFLQSISAVLLKD